MRQIDGRVFPDAAAAHLDRNRVLVIRSRPIDRAAPVSVSPLEGDGYVGVSVLLHVLDWHYRPKRDALAIIPTGAS